MRILQISGASPSRTGDGRTATFATLRAVCGAGHRITYAYMAGRNSATDRAFAEELLETCRGNLTLLPLRGRMRWLEKPVRGLRAMAIGTALLGGKVCRGLLTEFLPTIEKIRRLTCLMHSFDRSIIRRLEAALAEQPYDAIEVDYPWMIPVATWLPSSLPKLFVAHEIQTEIVRQAYPDDRLLHETVRNLETSQLKHYDAVGALSLENAELLRKELEVSHVVYSPLTIDCSRRRTVGGAAGSDPRVRLTFLGGHGHRPNADAVRWLCREIVPRLRAAIPGMRVQIVGKYPPAFVNAFGAADVSFVGFVEDLGTLIPGSIFLCPIRFGSGIRIKIVDAILHGAPVISTMVGALGLGLEAGKHFLAADSPDAFVRQAVRLAEDGSFRTGLCQSAQQQVVATFSAEATSRRRVAVIEEMIRRHRPSHAPDRRKAA